MDGIIRYKRSSYVSLFFFMLSGVVLALLMTMVFIKSKGELTSGDIGIVILFIVLGLFCLVCGVFLIRRRKKCHIHVEKDRIEAFCQVGGALSCGMDDVDHLVRNGIRYVDRQGTEHEDTALQICLKGGKKYEVWHLENGEELYWFIRKGLPTPDLFEGTPGDMDALLSEREVLKKKYKRLLIPTPGGPVLVILLILIQNAFTEGRDLSEFTSRDWRIFWVFAGIGLLLVAAAAVSLVLSLRLQKQAAKTEAAIRTTILLTAPLRPGKALRMFFDDPKEPVWRLVVYGLLGDDGVFYTLETVGEGGEPALVTESKMYKNFAELEPELEGLIEAPLPVESGNE